MLPKKNRTYKLFYFLNCKSSLCHFSLSIFCLYTRISTNQFPLVYYTVQSQHLLITTNLPFPQWYLIKKRIDNGFPMSILQQEQKDLSFIYRTGGCFWTSQMFRDLNWTLESSMHSASLEFKDINQNKKKNQTPENQCLVYCLQD